MSRESATPNQIEATRILLIEIAEILEPYPRAVIAGGTVPYLLIPQDSAPHEGTVDIDIVLDLDQPGTDAVYTLHEILERRLFQQDTKKPFRYTKVIEVEGEDCMVLIELLGGGDPPPNGLSRIQTEDVYVSIISGIEVALDNPAKIMLPDKPDQAILVASIPTFFTMKAVALERRGSLIKTKDAYDIIYCLRNYPGGVQAIAEEFGPALINPLVSSGLALLRILFESPEAIGPQAFSRQATDEDEEGLMRREAFERISELLSLLDGKVQPSP